MHGSVDESSSHEVAPVYRLTSLTEAAATAATASPPAY